MKKYCSVNVAIGIYKSEISVFFYQNLKADDLLDAIHCLIVMTTVQRRQYYLRIKSSIYVTPDLML